MIVPAFVPIIRWLAGGQTGTKDVVRMGGEMSFSGDEFLLGSAGARGRRAPDLTGKAGYFTCKDSMYLPRLLTRCCTSPSWPWLIAQKTLPQTGISRLP